MAYGAGLIIRIAIAAVIAVIFGNGSVVAFNRLPARWFEDYDEADSALPPDERRTVLPKKLLESDSMGRQRLPSTPWKYAFTGYFALCGIYLAIRGNGISYEISVLCVECKTEKRYVYIAFRIGIATDSDKYIAKPTLFACGKCICSRVECTCPVCTKSIPRPYTACEYWLTKETMLIDIIKVELIGVIVIVVPVNKPHSFGLCINSFLTYRFTIIV
jgi:hypothetical protein